MSSLPPRLCALIGHTVGLLCVARVAAATPTARLVYSRTADAGSCPDEGALRRAVAARVGYDPFFAWAQRTVVASIIRKDRSFVASVDLVDEHGITHGARELHVEGECTELLDAVALAIAIAIDPRSLAGPITGSPSPPSEAPQPVPVPAPATPPPPAIAPSTSPHVEQEAPAPPAPASVVEVEPSLGLVASTGVSPMLALGFSLGAGVRWRAGSIALEGRADVPTSATAQGGGSVSSWLALASLVPCIHLGPFFGCGVVQAGSMQAASSGVPDARSRATEWWAAGGRGGALFPITGAMQLRARVDVVADLRRAALQLNGGDAWRADPVAVSLGADAVFHFR